jgi:outer membrane protein assembly factor BamB
MCGWTTKLGRWAAMLLLATTGALQAEDWPQFRGMRRDGIARETGLLRAWPEDGPRVLWTVPVAQGYSGAAIVGGKVFHNDYDESAKTWRVYCRDLQDGKELWRFSEKRRIRPNHGITRSVPAVTGTRVIAIDPKCVVHGLDAATGAEVWRKSLVKAYHAKIPAWYNGQCPLLDGERVIIATGGDALLVALDVATGEEIWRTPNPDKHLLTHSTVMPATLGGVKQYLWCTLAGPLGVAADDGRLLWSLPRKFNVAVAPSALALDDERVFMTSGYNAGSVMFRVKRDGEAFHAEKIFDWDESEWNSEVHTPIIHNGHLFGVGKKKRGLFTCLDFDGKQIWNSRDHAAFGLGSYLLADGMFFVLEGKTGMLRLIEADATRYHELARAPVLAGHDVWAPMALADGKLVLRDMAQMKCIDVGGGAVGAD